ncbi:zinc finger domain-containing protein [Paenibacillus woosongensis]|uniref:Com family DNA-binding transcriptional regulator n=1 Tax=Paenibacillus woosongensis TaxID=307580 RepID=A0A7X3CL51_9BACL|nr:Com family DNA-binding transcriptional regulator [Paenibacillus woosongensis]
MQAKRPFRCSNCGKLLGFIKGFAEIKCPRCQNYNVIDTSKK